MKFGEAVIKLEDGFKVTRQPWVGSVYFLMIGDDVKSYQPKLSAYIYNEDIMVSDGWLIEDNKEEQKFYEIIPDLQAGKKAHMKDWKERYIYLDQTLKGLAMHSMEMFPFSIDFGSFIAQDWVEIT